MIVPRSFYLRPTLEVAPDLIGKNLVYHSQAGIVKGEITEVEAYIGQDDLACHAAAGRTPRTETMFWEGGHTYIYLIYGMYYCLNVVTEAKDYPAAVLIRAVRPIEGIDIMCQNRFGKVSKHCTAAQVTHLSDGPGKLCKAFNLTKSQNAIDLVKSSDLFIEDVGRRIDQSKILTTPRIGIRQATEKLWRFFLPGS